MNKFWWEDRPQRSLTEMALDIVCTFCGQQPGSWCRTMAGRDQRSSYLHGARTGPMYEAYWVGAAEHRDDLLRISITDPERFAEYRALMRQRLAEEQR